MAKVKQSIQERVLRNIRENRLLRRGQKLVAAVSGGADSVCLLHVLCSLREELGISLHVAHLDHGLRGDESAADARYVAALGAKLGIPAAIQRRDVRVYRLRHRLSLEEAAREVRYGFLAEVARVVGADRVAVGHTQDDHIETMLLHLVRGSGIKGLGGLQPLATRQVSGSTLTIVRPLLEISRAETAQYSAEHGLEPRLDASNLSLSPLRNRIRLKLLPQLAEYNPRIRDALRRTARLATDEAAFLEGEVGRRWGKVDLQVGTVTLGKEKFNRLPLALKRQLLRSSMESLLGNLKDIEARHIEAMLAAAARPAGRSINLPEGLKFVVEYDRYLITGKTAALSPYPPLDGEVKLNVPGLTRLPGWKVTARTNGERTDGANVLSACFDMDVTGKDLTVRRRKTGDRFQPFGMPAAKKVGQFMIDAKVPRGWRDRVPIVTSQDRIVWLAGWRIDERARVTEKTKRILYLEFTREEEDE